MSDKLTINDIEIKPRNALVVINEAINRHVYDGKVPANDDKKIEVANGIIEVAFADWYSESDVWMTTTAGIDKEIADDIKAVLAGAGVYPDGNGDLFVDKPRQIVDHQPERHKEVENVTEAQENLTQARQDATEQLKEEEPWEGYSKQTVAQIKAFLAKLRSEGSLTEDKIDWLHNYELNHKNRKMILAELDIPPVDPVASEGHDELDSQLDEVVAHDEKETETEETVDAADLEQDGSTSQEGASESQDESRQNQNQGLAGVREASERVINELEKENLPIPAEPQFDSDPVLPRDISTLSHEQVNQLALDFTACLSRATYLVALARIDNRNAKRVLEYIERRQLAHYAGGGEGSLAEWKSKALAESSEDVEQAHAEVDRTKDNLDGFEALRDHYKASYDALSRVEGFRHDEADRSR